MNYCPSCGGSLRFEIESQKMLCDHCGNRYEPETILDDVKDDAKAAPSFDGYVYVCPSCGGELMTVAKTDAVGFCPYCGGTSMIFDKVRKEWAPDYVVPFKITKEQCKQLYIDEVKKHPFVSKKYRDPQLIDSFRGIYMPYWNYVAESDGSFQIEAAAEEKYAGSGTYKTDIYEVKGDMEMHMEGYTHDASAAFDDSLSEAIAPYDDTERKPFMPGYLRGFYAEIADVSEENFKYEAKKELEEFAVSELKRDALVNQTLSKQKLTPTASPSVIPMKITSAKRVLRPVWFMSYRNKNKVTYAVVNGQTGKLTADLPMSPVRILVAAAIAFGVLLALLLLGMSFLPSIKAGPTLGVGILLMLVGLFYTRKSFCFSMDEYYLRESFGSSEHFVQISDIVAVVCALIGLLCINSDGSYVGKGRVVGNIFLIPSLIALIIKYVSTNGTFKKIKLRMKQAPHEFRMGTVIEAQKYLRREGWLRILCYVTMGVAFTFVVADTRFKGTMYGIGLLLMAELFILVLNAVYFQSEVAKRMPPQFNKKGALYDEN